MRQVYYIIWVSLAFVHHKISNALFNINKVFFRLMKKSIEDQRKWKNDYNNGFLGFPGGMIDWAAYGLFTGLFLIPVMVVTLKYEIDIYTQNRKWYFIGIAAVIGFFCYYWIYFRSIDWLKKRINKVAKKYYLK